MGVHNGASLVGSAIESIVLQTYDNWELIVVDDGSTDETLAVVKSWASRDSRVCLLEHQVNLGLAASLNHAFSRARGELIARQDADDFSFPDRLRKQVSYLDAHPDVAVLGTGAEFVDENGTALKIGLMPEQHDDISSNIYRKSPFIHPSVMMRRTFLEPMGGYDPRLRRAEDIDLWTRGHRNFIYHNLPEPLVRFRVRRNGGVDSATILVGAFVLARAAYRDGCLLSHGPYACRYLVSSLLIKAGLRRRRLPGGHQA